MSLAVPGMSPSRRKTLFRGRAPTSTPELRKDVRPRAAIQVNVTLDSSLDTEKLEKQLALLGKYGAL